jgi:SAM-dependent methyltransferase
MGIPACILPIINVVLGKMAPPPGKTLRGLALGYPDLLATRKNLVDIFGPAIEAHLAARDDSDAVNRWHGTSELFPEIFETVAFFAALGVTLDCIDITAARGFERIVDLNHPLPADMVGAYDLVFDFGTTEHCFNIGQAMVSCASALAPGGCVVHQGPLNIFNHGFYNFNPTFYADFYSQNGFELLFLSGMVAALTAPKMFDLPPNSRFKEAPVDSGVMAIARRTNVQPIVWPVQQKYRENPTLKR